MEWQCYPQLILHYSKRDNTQDDQNDDGETNTILEFIQTGLITYPNDTPKKNVHAMYLRKTFTQNQSLNTINSKKQNPFWGIVPQVAGSSPDEVFGFFQFT
jgi:hypothetical protein